MKKIKKSLLFSYILFSIYGFSHSVWVEAILDSDLWLDLYKNIDSWLYDLEISNYQYWMTEWWKVSVAQKINNAIWLGWMDCIKDDITFDDVDKIANNWDLVILSNAFKDECKDDKWNWTVRFSNKALADYLALIKDVHSKVKTQSEEKAKAIYDISRIWLYSDWDISNSPFDLIKDMEDIDAIIFDSYNKYEWVEQYPNWNPLTNLLSWLLADWKTSYLPNLPKVLVYYTGWTITPVSPIYFSKTVSSSQLICSDTFNKSWLDDNVVNKLLWKKTNSWTFISANLWNIQSFNWLNTWNFSSSWNLLPLTAIYSKVNDNAMWNCDSFFCLAIDFVKANYKWLIWTKNISIEWILAKSNEHVHKFANTSSLQKKMSINNWELSLKNLNFQKIFNLNFVITSKSPPILNLDRKEDWKDLIDKNSPLWWENLTKDYYKNSWLDYSRANSIQDIKKVIEELKCTNDWWELSISEVWDKCNQYRDYIQKQEQNNQKITKLTKEVVNMWDLNTFYDMFAELKIFTKAFSNYVNWIRTQAVKMDKKPAG